MSEDRILLLFVDGVGLAPATESNPLATIAMPTLTALLGGPLTQKTCRRLSEAGEAGAADGQVAVGLGRLAQDRSEPVHRHPEDQQQQKPGDQLDGRRRGPHPLERASPQPRGGAARAAVGAGR